MSGFEFGEAVRLIEGLSTELQRLEARVDAGFKELHSEIAELRYSFDRQDAAWNGMARCFKPVPAG